jgi:hypothetical protein
VQQPDYSAEIIQGTDLQAEWNTKRAVPTFEEESLEHYMPDAKVQNRGWRKKLQMYELRLGSAFGHKRITGIKRAEVHSWHVTLREDGISPACADRFLAFLRHVLNICVESDLMEKNLSSMVQCRRRQDRNPQRSAARGEKPEFWNPDRLECLWGCQDSSYPGFQFIKMWTR